MYQAENPDLLKVDDKVALERHFKMEKEKGDRRWELGIPAAQRNLLRSTTG